MSGILTAEQRIATLMDEADKARLEIERLNVLYNEQCEDSLIGHHFMEKVLTEFVRGYSFSVKVPFMEDHIAELEKERDAARLAAEAFCRGQDAAIAERDAAQVTLVNFRMDELEPALNQVDDLRAERDGLRRAIEEAPHDFTCISLEIAGTCLNDAEEVCGWSFLPCKTHRNEKKACDCWKTRALAAVSASEDLK